MSYEHLGAIRKGPARRLSFYGEARTGAFRSRPQGRLERLTREAGTVRRRYITPPGTSQLYGYDDGLGISFKPPKWARKAATAVKKAVTLKRVLTAGAIVGAAVLFPGAIPAIAKGGLAIGRAALGAGRGAIKFLGHEAGALTNLIRKPVSGGQTYNPATGQPIDAGTGLPIDPGIYQGTLPTPPPVFAPAAPSAGPTISPDAGSYGGGGGGGFSPSGSGAALPSPGDTSAAPDQAGMGAGSNMAPLLIGGAIVLALAASQRRVRRSR